MTDRDQQQQELTTLMNIVHECGLAILSAASPVGLRGHNIPTNHGLTGTCLSPADLTLSGSSVGIRTAQVLEAMTVLVAEIEQEQSSIQTRGVADE